MTYKDKGSYWSSPPSILTDSWFEIVKNLGGEDPYDPLSWQVIVRKSDLYLGALLYVCVYDDSRLSWFETVKMLGGEDP